MKFKIIHCIAQYLLKHNIKGRGRLITSLSNLLPTPQKKQEIQTSYHCKMYINAVENKSLEHKLYCTGTYEMGTLQIIEKILKPGDSVVDAGANIGVITLLAAKCVGADGHVISIEPHPQTAQRLRENIALNLFENTTVIESALGEKNDTGILYLDDQWQDSGGASLINNIERTCTQTQITIQALDSIQIPTPITLIKMDVEGYELEALKGGASRLSQKESPVLIIEAGDNPEEILTYLKSLNTYQAFRLEKGKQVPSKLIPVKDAKAVEGSDNMFCLLPCHIAKYPELF